MLTGHRGQHQCISDAVFQSVSTARDRRHQFFGSRKLADRYVVGRRGQAVAPDQCSASQRRRGDRDRRVKPRDGAHPAPVPRDRAGLPRRRRRRRRSAVAADGQRRGRARLFASAADGQSLQESGTRRAAYGHASGSRQGRLRRLGAYDDDDDVVRR